MAKYEDLSWGKIGEFLNLLNKYARLVKKDPSDENVRSFAIYLYEYLVVYGGFKKNYSDFQGVVKEAKYGLSNIRDYVPRKDKDYNHVLLSLKGFADTFRHMPVEKTSAEYFRDFVKYYDFYYTIFDALLPHNSYVFKFVTSKKELNRLTQQLTFNANLRVCKLYVSRCLTVDSSIGRSQYTIGETLDSTVAKFKCSETDAMSLIFEVIKDDWRV